MVIILHHPQQQIGPQNKEFLELLMRLQEGWCTVYDYDLLSSHVIKPSMNLDFGSEPWQHAPVIVYDNAVKDAINM